mmetsp:Transcript_13028/g.21352  ORF Transcript_13028/g.21352 Transcript_13028/m.21352 type:complete len:125 (-) Transcript_13028:2125-2499(-)
MTTPRAVKSLYRELLREARNWPKASRSGPLLVSAIEARTKTLFREHVNVVDEAKALEMFSEGRKELAALKTIRENVFKKMYPRPILNSDKEAQASATKALDIAFGSSGRPTLLQRARLFFGLAA